MKSQQFEGGSFFFFNDYRARQIIDYSIVYIFSFISWLQVNNIYMKTKMHQEKVVIAAIA